MFFRQLGTRESSLSYFFGCGTLGKAVAVDVVAGDEDWFIEQANTVKSEITHVIDTHIHSVHYSGDRNLAAITGAVYCLHEGNQGCVKFPFTPLHDGQIIEAGNTILNVMHTPGHTTDGMSLVVTDKRRGRGYRPSELAWLRHRDLSFLARHGLRHRRARDGTGSQCHGIHRERILVCRHCHAPVRWHPLDLGRRDPPEPEPRLGGSSVRLSATGRGNLPANEPEYE